MWHDSDNQSLVKNVTLKIQNFIEEWQIAESVRAYWRPPLVAIASASDPLFPRLREVAADDHLMPTDLLEEARSVVSFFLPFEKELGAENDQADFYAARSWAKAYVTTNRLIGAINDHLHASLRESGFESAVTPATHNFDEERLLSGWSHKHVAYIAGLGTFGHHHLLITSSGCCGRLGSLVTDALLPVTPRSDKENCLTKAGGKCLACVKKCQYGVLEENVYDRHACYRQLLRNDRHYEDLPLVDVCGKCGCQVPCSYQIPAALLKDR